MAGLAPIIDSQFTLPANKAQTSPPLDPIYSRGSGTLPPHLDDLTFIEYKRGAGGGVNIYRDSNRKKWTIKSWANEGHGVNEIIGGELLNLLGVKTPSSFVYKDLPGHLKEREGRNKFFRIAEFIEGRQPESTEIQEHFTPHYATLAFLSMWDTKANNLIINKQGEFYYIDTGSALLYRARGETRPESRHRLAWSAFQVTEFESFFDNGMTINRASASAAVDPSQRTVLKPEKAVFDQSIQQILAKSDEILTTANTLSETFSYAGHSDLINMLTARFQHLTLLDRINRKQLDPNAERYALAGAYDAGGVLCWTPFGPEDKAHILIGRRKVGRGTGTWVILGGGSDKGETLSEMSAREVHEESGGRIKLSTADLEAAPTHDLITLTEHGSYRRFRTYLKQTPHINPQEIANEEFFEYAWISIDELIKAANNTTGHFTLDEGKEGTLFPPFKTALNQPQMQDWLSHLQANTADKIKRTCTQGIADMPDLTHIDKPQQRFQTQYAKDAQLIQHLCDRTAFRRTLKASLNPRRPFIEGASYKRYLQHTQNPTPAAEPALLTTAKAHGGAAAAAGATSPQTASLVMLNRFYPGMTLDAQLRAAIAKAKSNRRKTVNASEVKRSDIALAKKIIAIEAQNPDAHFAYHGLKTDIWLSYRVLSIIRGMLDETKEVKSDTFRTFQTAFDALPDAEALRNFVLTGKRDNAPEFNGISCNFSLFNNLDISSECTLSYFLAGFNAHAPQDIWRICSNLFEALGLPAQALTESIETIYQTHFAKENITGALLQVTMQGDTLFNKANYVSGWLGTALVYPETHPNAGTTPAPSDISEMMKTGTDFLLAAKGQPVHEGRQFGTAAQLRLHGDLPKLVAEAKSGDSLDVIDHFNGDVDLREIDTQLTALLTPYMPKIQQSLLREGDIYNVNPALLRVGRVLLDVPAYERKTTPHIIRAYQNNDIQQVLSLLRADPSSIEATGFNNHTLEDISLNESWAEKLIGIDDHVAQDLIAKNMSLLVQKMSSLMGRYLVPDEMNLIIDKLIDADLTTLGNRVQNTLKLIKKSVGAHEALKIINVLEEIDGAFERDNIVKNAIILIKERLKSEEAIKIMSALFIIKDQDERNIVAQNASLLTQKGMDGTKIAELVKYVQTLEDSPEQRNLLQNAGHFMKPGMDANHVTVFLDILRTIPDQNEQKAVAKNAGRLMHAKMSEQDIRKITQAIQDIKDPAQQENISKTAALYMNDSRTSAAITHIISELVPHAKTPNLFTDFKLALRLTNQSTTTTIDTMIRLLVCIHTIDPKIRIGTVKNTAKLIRKMRSVGHVIQVTDALKAIPDPQKQADVVHNAALLIANRTSTYELIPLIERLAMFDSAAQQACFVRNTLKLTRKETTNRDYILVIDNLAKIHNEDKQSDIAESLFLLLDPRYYSWELERSIKTLISIEGSGSLTDEVKRALALKPKASFDDAIAIVKAFMSIEGTPKRHSIAREAVSLITDQASATDIVDITKLLTVIEHSDMRANILQKISPFLKKGDISELIRILDASTDPAAQAFVIEDAVPLIRDDMAIIDIEKILRALATIANSTTRADIVNKASSLIRPHMNGGQISNVIKVLDLIPTADKRQNILANIQTLQKDTMNGADIYHITKALLTIEAPQMRNNVTANTAKLMVEGMNGKAVTEIITALRGFKNNAERDNITANTALLIVKGTNHSAAIQIMKKLTDIQSQSQRANVAENTAPLLLEGMKSAIIIRIIDAINRTGRTTRADHARKFAALPDLRQKRAYIRTLIGGSSGAGAARRR